MDLRIVAIAVLGSLGAANAVAAADSATFDPAAFARAQAHGRLTVVETYAGWCPPCRIQEPILKKLQLQARYHGMRIFRVGEMSPQTTWNRFGLVGYGTLVVFRGYREVGRGIPTTEEAVIQLLRRRT